MKKKASLLTGFLTLAVVAVGFLITSLPEYSEAQVQEQRDEQRMERQRAREVRQGGREIAQDGKKVCRKGDNNRAECRQLKRGFKQETREGARAIRR